MSISFTVILLYTFSYAFLLIPTEMRVTEHNIYKRGNRCKIIIIITIAYMCPDEREDKMFIHTHIERTHTEPLSH